MAISDEVVASVRGATDLVALIGEHVALRRQGQRWVGRCPFHQERTPSFSVNAEMGVYYCFGCRASGDAITFVRATEHLEFAEAVERLADRAGIQVRRDDGAAGARRRQRARLLEALDAAVSWYHERLRSHPDAGRAREYLRSRGYDSDVVSRFRLGWAPDDWDALCRSLRLPDAVVRDAGLGFVNRLGRQQDAFRGRVIFPIFDPSGRPIALGGRVLPGGGEPKYKNSVDSPLYAKRRTLYGLNWAKGDIAASGEVVVCEGYTDVIAVFRAGVPRAVATCGTALAEEHFQLLRNFARRVVLAYDADRAGQAAALRFYEWERRHELDIAVADLPAGTDPPDLGQQDPERLRAAIAGARPFLEFRVRRILAGGDLTTAEGRAKVAEAAMDVVAEHPGELVRDQYVMEVASRCRVDPDRLRERLRRPGRRVGPAVGPATAAGGPPVDRLELEGLRLAVHRPEEVAGRLDEVLFADQRCRAAFRALAGAATWPEALSGAGQPVADLLNRLAVEETDADAGEVRRRLVKAAAERALHEVNAEARTSEDRFADLARVAAWLKLGIEDLSDLATAEEAADRLLAWLVKWAVSEGR